MRQDFVSILLVQGLFRYTKVADTTSLRQQTSPPTSLPLSAVTSMLHVQYDSQHVTCFSGTPAQFPANQIQRSGSPSPRSSAACLHPPMQLTIVRAWSAKCIHTYSACSGRCCIHVEIGERDLGKLLHCEKVESFCLCCLRYEKWAHAM